MTGTISILRGQTIQTDHQRSGDGRSLVDISEGPNHGDRKGHIAAIIEQEAFQKNRQTIYCINFNGFIMGWAKDGILATKKTVYFSVRSGWFLNKKPYKGINIKYYERNNGGIKSFFTVFYSILQYLTVFYLFLQFFTHTWRFLKKCFTSTLLSFKW